MRNAAEVVSHVRPPQWDSGAETDSGHTDQAGKNGTSNPELRTRN